MNYNELQDKSIKKLAEIDRRLENGFTLPNKLNPEAAKTFDSLKKHLLPNPAVQRIRALVLSEEQKLKKAKTQLSTAEFKKLKSKSMQRILAETEGFKKKTIMKILDEISSLENEHRENKSKRSTERLADLQEYQLSTRFLDESTAMQKLVKIAQNGEYSEAELLSLGSISPLTFKKAREIMSETPPHLASPKGKSLLTQLERITNLGTGELSYFIRDEQNNRSVASSINALDFFSEERNLAPTANDFQPEPAAQAAG